MSKKTELVLFEKEGRLATVTINRPNKLNALSLKLMDAFSQVLEAVRSDAEISVVLVTGADEYFSAGADLDYLKSLKSPKKFTKTLKTCWHANFNAIEDMQKLFIAAINGTAIGGALELALACDLRVAAESAHFALPQIDYGLIPDSGGTNRLARLIGAARTKELVFSGAFITSREARRIGLLNRVFPDDEFATAVRKYAGRFLAKSPMALGLGKLAINRSIDLNISDGLNDAAAVQMELLGSEEYRQAVKAFDEKRHK